MRLEIVEIAMAAGILLLLKWQKRFSHSHYFYYSQLLERGDYDPSLFGIAYRTLIPFVCGVIAGLIGVGMGLTHSPARIGLTTGALAAFLVVWPSIIAPTENNPLEFRRRLKLLYLLRGMFVALYSMLGLMGGLLAPLLAVGFASVFQIEWSAWIDKKGIITNLLSEAILAVFIAVAYKAIGKIQHKLDR